MMKSRTLVAAGLAALAALGVVATIHDARAAGLYVSDRGVRPFGRGGAFVAGADDLGAIWYNPAGIVEAPSSLLLDGSWINYHDTFTRNTQATSSTGTTYDVGSPTVKGTTPFLPIPTIAGSYRWGENKQYAVAFGIYAPDAAILSYPGTVSTGGETLPAPQRYSLISLKGSILAVIGGWFSYKPIDELRIGAGVQMLTGYFKTAVDFSACPPDHFVCAPEDSNYQALSQINAGPIFAPSANAGATFVPNHFVRVGISGQAPFVINAPATVNVRLPTASEFDNATQQGTSAHLHLELPPILRAGVEIRPFDDDDLRIELAYVREFWSVEKSLDITPDNIQLYNITGFPSPFGVNKISVPRGMKDSNSFRLGIEDAIEILTLKFRLRAGVSYETSAVPPSYVAPLTVDNNKVIASIGGSIVVSKQLRLDGVVSHTIQGDVHVTPQEAAVPLINPVQGNPTATETVNGGTYHVNEWTWAAASNTGSRRPSRRPEGRPGRRARLPTRRSRSGSVGRTCRRVERRAVPTWKDLTREPSRLRERQGPFSFLRPRTFSPRKGGAVSPWGRPSIGGRPIPSRVRVVLLFDLDRTSCESSLERGGKRARPVFESKPVFSGNQRRGCP